MITEEIFKQHFVPFIDDYGGDSQAAKSRFSKQHLVHFIDDYGGDFQAAFFSLYR